MWIKSWGTGWTRMNWWMTTQGIICLYHARKCTMLSSEVHTVQHLSLVACVLLLTALFPQLMWKLREGITEGLLHDGYVYKYDISLPHSSFYAIIPELKTLLPADKVGRICGYGHVGRFQIGMYTACQSLCLWQTSPHVKLSSVCTCCLISNFCHVVNVVFFRFLLVYSTYEAGTECYKTLAHITQMPGSHPKERVYHSQHVPSSLLC